MEGVFRSREEIKKKLDQAEALMDSATDPHTIGYVEGLRRALVILDDSEREAKRVVKMCEPKATGYRQAIEWAIQGKGP